MQYLHKPLDSTHHSKLYSKYNHSNLYNHLSSKTLVQPPHQQVVVQQPPQQQIVMQPPQQQVVPVNQQTYQHQTVTQDPNMPLFPQITSALDTVQFEEPSEQQPENRQQQQAVVIQQQAVQPAVRRGRRQQQQATQQATQESAGDNRQQQQQMPSPLQTRTRVSTPVHQTPRRRQPLSPVGNEEVVHTTQPATSTPRKTKV